jgi:2-keto-4-pentenoate hydratase
MSYPTVEYAADARVRSGMEAQLGWRRAALEGGDEPLGWKVGFGTPSAFERFGTSAPMTGYLLRSGLIEAGRPVPLSGWSNPALEAEVAVVMGSDLPAGGDADAARASIGALAAAFELVDLDPSVEEVAGVLEANIFQRAVILGPRGEGTAPEDLSATLQRAGEETQEVGDPQSATGEVVAIVRHVADLLGEFGERLRVGEVVITGAITPPPIPVSAGERFDFELRPLGRMSIAFE